MKIEHVDVGSEEWATVRIQGLEEEVKVMHITDTHIIAGDSRDPEATQHVDSYGPAFGNSTPEGVPTTKLFASLLDGGLAMGADCTALTGDIIHFPSQAALEIVEAGVRRLDSPYVYTLGNHDWYYPHLQWNDATRQEYYPRFYPFTRDNPACQVVEVGGVRLVALDNSTYQVTDAQVHFLRQQLASGQPCLLFIHIPLSLTSLAPVVMERWDAPIMMGAEKGWNEENRRTWRTGGPLESTRSCCELITGSEAGNLAAVFCGHVHFSHAGEFAPGRYQYVTAPGFEGHSRFVRLLPM